MERAEREGDSLVISGSKNADVLVTRADFKFSV